MNPRFWLAVHYPDKTVEAAEDTDTPVEVLLFLVEHESDAVRAGVARNPNTPIVTLQLLLQDDTGWVAQTVLRNPHLPRSDFEHGFKKVKGEWDRQNLPLHRPEAPYIFRLFQRLDEGNRWEVIKAVGTALLKQQVGANLGGLDMKYIDTWEWQEEIKHSRELSSAEKDEFAALVDLGDSELFVALDNIIGYLANRTGASNTDDPKLQKLLVDLVRESIPDTMFEEITDES